jgi:hypothetical protein
MRRWTLVLTTAGLVLAGGGASAQEREPPACPMALLFEQTPAPLRPARIVGEGKVRLRSDGPGCPDDSRACLMKPYLVGGNEVVAGLSRKGWTCVYFPNAKGGAEGWVRDAEVTGTATPPAPAPAWAGKWVREEDAELTLEAAAADVVVSGDAQWVGPNPDNVHVGEMSGQARPDGDTVVLPAAEAFDCGATLRLLGPNLAVSDNGRCGGANVTFTGVYRRIGR